jgi:hypothetical protein
MPDVATALDVQRCFTLPACGLSMQSGEVNFSVLSPRPASLLRTDLSVMEPATQYFSMWY